MINIESFNLTLRLRGIFVAIAAAVSISSALAFTPNEKLVSTPEIQMPDIEFDRTNFQVAWEDRDQKLWVADVSPVDGTFDLAHRLLLDTGLTPLDGFQDGTGTGNGPEWEFNTGRSQVLYTKLIGSTRGDLEVYHAVENSGGLWSVGPFSDANALPFGRKGFVPIGNRRENDPDPAFSFYQVTNSASGVALAWRKLNSPIGSIVSELPSGIGRWASGVSNLLAYPRKTSDGGRQIFIFDTNTQLSKQVTFSASSKTDPWIFNAPDLDGLQVMAVLETQPGQPTVIGLYREDQGNWVRFNAVRPPTTLKELDSPEPAIFNGQSYMFCSALNQKGSPSEIWLMGIRPDAKFYRQVSNPKVALARQDAEYMGTSSGLFIYYAETGKGNIFKCAAGVGPKAANIINGTGSSDTLVGTASNDYIAGKVGPDTLAGGAGVDQFAYFNKADRGDVITDFTPGTDLIDMGFLMYEAGYQGKDPVADGFLQFVTSGTDTQIWVDFDGRAGSAAAFPYITIKNVPLDRVQNKANFIY